MPPNIVSLGGMMFHHQHVDEFKVKYNDLFYAIFRVLIGVLFMFHGLQKVFGIFAQNGAQQMLSFMWWVGIVEFLGGLFVALGLLTTIAAIASAT
jgi:putative oxidoreductase